MPSCIAITFIVRGYTPRWHGFESQCLLEPSTYSKAFFPSCDHEVFNFPVLCERLFYKALPISSSILVFWRLRTILYIIKRAELYGWRWRGPCNIVHLLCVPKSPDIFYTTHLDYCWVASIGPEHNCHILLEFIRSPIPLYTICVQTLYLCICQWTSPTPVIGGRMVSLVLLPSCNDF